MTAIHKTPSRKKYEQRKPVFSVRMPIEWIDAVKLYCQKTNRSREEFMGLALNKISEDYEKVSKQSHDKGKTEGNKEGYNVGLEKGKAEGLKTGQEQARKDGYEQGKKEWALWVYCYSCNKLLYIPPGSEAHEYIRAVMTNKLRHPTCPP
jgi:flagellar biosynthesis/type III secretory pathway protein FliH